MVTFLGDFLKFCKGMEEEEEKWKEQGWKIPLFAEGNRGLAPSFGGYLGVNSFPVLFSPSKAVRLISGAGR